MSGAYNVVGSDNFAKFNTGLKFTLSALSKKDGSEGLSIQDLLDSSEESEPSKKIEDGITKLIAKCGTEAEKKQLYKLLNGLENKDFKINI